jgi:hypothetical protein
MIDLRRQLDQNKISQDQYNKAIQQSAQVIQAYQQNVKDITQQLDKLEEAGGGFRLRGGMRVDLILTSAFRDLASETSTATEKIEHMTRTIPYLLNMFGVGGAWGIALGLAGTAVVELYNHWNDFLTLLGSPTAAAAKQAQDAIDEMAKNAKKAVDDFRKHVEAPAEEERLSIQALGPMFQGVQGRAMQDALIAAMAATRTGPRPDIQWQDVPMMLRAGLWTAAGGQMPSQAVLAGIPQVAQARDERLKAERLARAQALMQTAMTGETRAERDEARTMIMALYQAQPGLFGAAGRDLPWAMPEGIRRAEAEQDAGPDFNALQERRRAGQLAARGAARRQRHLDQSARQYNKMVDDYENDAFRAQAAENRTLEQNIKQGGKDADASAKAQDKAARQAYIMATAGNLQTDVAAATGGGQVPDYVALQAAQTAVRHAEATGNAMEAYQAAMGQLIQKLMNESARAERSAAKVNGMMGGMNHQGMGADNSGNFSALAPAWLGQ